MPKLRSRSRSKASSDEIKKSVKKAKNRVKPEFEPRFDKVVSTGSTLLDLAISGKRIRGGGIPGGIYIEIYGPNSSGKTALACEILASAQIRGGKTKFGDGEARLDAAYAAVYDFLVDIDDEDSYFKPNTAPELFDGIRNWEPEQNEGINVFAADSIAVLSTDLELSEEGDKRGQKRAKEIHAGLRKTRIKVERENIIVVLTNHELDGSTPGGKGPGFYASLRLRIAPQFPNNKIVMKKKIGKKKKEVSVTKGVISTVTVKKSSIDEPYRTAPDYIMFNVGIDDIRANLQWQKDMTGDTKYLAVDEEFARINDAIKYIEDEELEDELRENIIDLWEDIQSKFEVKRKKKKRR